jgi:hypothetical protein
MNNVSWHYSGETKGYHISLDSEEVHFTESPYERDMFTAELKAILNKINKWLEPKCDLCGKPAEKNNHLQSDGIGLLAHEKCWEETTYFQSR